MAQDTVSLSPDDVEVAQPQSQQTPELSPQDVEVQGQPQEASPAQQAPAPQSNGPVNPYAIPRAPAELRAAPEPGIMQRAETAIENSTPAQNLRLAGQYARNTFDQLHKLYHPVQGAKEIGAGFENLGESGAFSGMPSGGGVVPMPQALRTNQPRKVNADQAALGATQVMQGVMEVTKPLVPFAVARAPLQAAIGYGAGILSGRAAADVAQKMGATPNEQEFFKTTLFFLPDTMLKVAGVHGAINPEVARSVNPATGEEETVNLRGGVVGGKGFAAGVAKGEPGQYQGAVRVGPYSARVNIGGGRVGVDVGRHEPGQPLFSGPESTPSDPVAEQTRQQANDAAMVAARAAGTTHMAEQATGMVPAPPPKPPAGAAGTKTPPPPAGIPEGHLSMQTVQHLGAAIMALPEQARPAAIMEATDKLTSWIGAKGTIIGPDGKLSQVTGQSPQAQEQSARVLAVKLVNDEIERQNQVQQQAKENTAVAVQEQEGHITEEGEKTTKAGEAQPEPTSIPNTVPVQRARQVLQSQQKNATSEQLEQAIRGAAVTTPVRKQLVQEEIARRANAKEEQANTAMTGEQPKEGRDAASIQKWADEVVAGQHPYVFVPKASPVKPSGVEALDRTEVKGAGPFSGTYYHSSDVSSADIRKAARDKKDPQAALDALTADFKNKQEPVEIAPEEVEEAAPVAQNEEAERKKLIAKQERDLRENEYGIPNGLADELPRAIQEEREKAERFGRNPNWRDAVAVALNRFNGQGKLPSEDAVRKVINAAGEMGLFNKQPVTGVAEESSNEGEKHEAAPVQSETEKPPSVSESKPVQFGLEEKTPETKYKFGNTQHDIAPESEAGKALEAARAKVDDADLMGQGKDVDGNHVTVRYGIQGDDVEGIKKFIAQHAPFEAHLGPVASFPPSEHSDGAAPLIAAVESPELHKLNTEIAKHGDFTEPSFKEYKPHATIAYVKPDAVDKYVGDKSTVGKTFRVDSITISDRDGDKIEVPLKGTSSVPQDFKPGQKVMVKQPDGTEKPGTIRFKHNNGKYIVNGERKAVAAENMRPAEGGEEKSERRPEGPAERFAKVQKAKADKYLDEERWSETEQRKITRRQRIDERLAQGGKIDVKQIRDEARVRQIERELERMNKGWVPTGNPNHPETIKYNALKQELKNGPKEPSYRMVMPDGDEYIINKTEYDYAKSKEASPAESAKPTPDKALSESAAEEKPAKAAPAAQVPTEAPKEITPYPERPHGENEAGFRSRLANRQPYELTKQDFLTHAAFEYLAGGERREKLIAAGMGTDEGRLKAHKQAVKDALTAGKEVPGEVLADYPELAPKVQVPSTPAKEPEKATEPPKTMDEQYAAGVSAYKARTPVADQNGYNEALNGLAAVLDAKGLKPSEKESERLNPHGVSGWVGDLSHLFHTPLASAKGGETPELLGRNMDFYVRPDPQFLRDNFSTWYFSSGHTAEHMQKELKDGRTAKDLEYTESQAKAGLKKADIVEALIGETPRIKEAREIANAALKRVADHRAYAEKQIKEAEGKEAEIKAAQDRLPVTRAERVRPLEALRLKPKEAWRSDKAIKLNDGWISDGNMAVDPAAAQGKAGEKAAAKLAPGDNAAKVSYSLDDLIPKNAKPLEFLGYEEPGPIDGWGGAGPKVAEAHFLVGNGKNAPVITFNAHKLRLMQNILGKDVSIEAKDNKSAAAFKKDGKVVGLLMPLRSENGAAIDVLTARKTMAAGGYKEPAQADEKPESESVIDRLMDESGQMVIPESLQKAGEYIGKAAATTLKDTLETARLTGRTMKQAGREVVAALYPRALASEDAKDILGRGLGRPALTLFRAGQLMDGLGKMFDHMPQDQQIDFIDRWQRGEEQPSQELQDAQALMQSIMDGQRAEEKIAINLGRKASQQIELEDKAKYFPNRYAKLPDGEKPLSEDEQMLRFQGTGKRPLEGSKRFLKQQKMTMKQAVEAGAEPLGSPVEILMRRLQEGAKFVAAKYIMHDGKEAGLAVFVKQGKPTPAGYTDVPDKIMKVWRPVETAEGSTVHQQTGRCVWQKDFGRLLNNYLSKNFIRGTAIGDSLVALKNATTEVRLSWSPFHWLYITTENWATGLSMGLDKLYNQGLRDLNGQAALDGLADIGKSIVAPYASVKTGGQMLQFAKNPDAFLDTPEGKKFAESFPDFPHLQELLFAGGLRWGMSEQNKASLGDDFTKQIAAGHLGKATLRFFPWLSHTLMKPLFEHYIPRAKWTFAAQMLSAKLNQYSQAIADGKITEDTIAREVVDTVENRFGEMNFDNLYWDNTMKTATQIMFRSASWKLGTWRGLAKAVQETFTSKAFDDHIYDRIENDPAWGGGAGNGGNGGGGGSAAGRMRDFTRRLPQLGLNTGWLMSMALVTSVLGSVMSKLATGKYPWQWAEDDHVKHGLNYLGAAAMEMMHPRTGKETENGQPVRVSFPTGLRDYEHAALHPRSYLHGSLADWAGNTWDTFLANRDAFGNYVFNSNDPTWKQFVQGLRYNLNGDFLPISVANYRDEYGPQDVPSRAARATGLIGGAPAFIDRSKATSEALALRPAHTPLTPEQQQEQKMTREHPTHSQVLRAARDKNLDYLERVVLHQLSYKDAKEIYDKYATPEERRELAPIIRRKQIYMSRNARR